MKKYYEFLYRLRADGVATQFALEQRGGGCFAEQIKECLQLGYVRIYDTTPEGQMRYCITTLGKQYLDN